MEFVAASNSHVTGLVRVGVEDCITTLPFTQKLWSFSGCIGLRLQTETCSDMSALIAQDVDLVLSCQPPNNSELMICQSKKSNAACLPLKIILLSSECPMIRTIC